MRIRLSQTLRPALLAVMLLPLAAGAQTATPEPDTLPKPVPTATFDELWARFTDPGGDTAYIVNFWATWCRPCVAELPHFEVLVDEYGDRPMKVVLLSNDDPADANTRVARFVHDRRIDAEVVVISNPDPNTWVDRVDPAWEGDLPYTVGINPKGETVARFKVIKNVNDLVNKLHPLLKDLP